MYNYKLVDGDGNVLGLVALEENESIPPALAMGLKFTLSCALYPGDSPDNYRIQQFVLTPNPVEKKPDDQRFIISNSNIISKVTVAKGWELFVDEEGRMGTRRIN